MTLQQLRCFLATVDGGFNISRAAEALYATQPAVSKQIRLLEDHVGSPLFARTSSRITGLTDVGERVLESARRILKETEGISHLGSDLMEQQSGRLTVASLHTYALAVLPSAMKLLRERHPRVALEVRQDSPAHIIELVRGGAVDIGVSMEVPDPRDGVVAFPFMEAPRILLTPKKHPLLGMEKVTLEQIAGFPLVAQTGLSAGGWAISRVLKSRSINVETAVLASDASLIKAYVESELGVAIVSSLLYDKQRDQGLRAIDVSHIFEPSQLTILMDPYRYQRGFVHEFVSLLAPDWTKPRIAAAMRQHVIDNEKAMSADR